VASRLLGVSGGFSACPVASWLLGLPGGSGGFSACPAAPWLRGLPGGSSASRLLAVSGGFAASWLLGLSGGFSACQVASRLRGFSACVGLLGFWSHFWAPFARALQQRQKTGRAKEGNGRGGKKAHRNPKPWHADGQAAPKPQQREN